MRTCSLTLLLLAACDQEPIQSDPDVSSDVTSEVVDITEPAISETEAMQIALTGLDTNVYSATSTITGPLLDDAGQTIEVYEVTVLGSDQLVLRYINDATGELLINRDAWHDLASTTAVPDSDTGGAPPPPSYYTSCPSGWPLCIRTPSSITFYSQNDPSWACNYLGNSSYYTLGDGTYGATCGHTMHSAGCLLATYDMAICQNHGTCVSLSTLNSAGQANGCFSGANLVHSCIAASEGATTTSINVDQVWSTLSSGKAVIAYGTSDCLGSSTSRPTHAQMIWGHDGSRYWTKDPWYDWSNQDQSLCLSSVRYYKVQ